MNHHQHQVVAPVVCPGCGARATQVLGAHEEYFVCAACGLSEPYESAAYVWHPAPPSPRPQPCGLCDHSSGQLDGLSCVYCGGTGLRHAPAAILSTTVLPLDGLYAVVGRATVGALTEGAQVQPLMGLGRHAAAPWCTISFLGVPHYVGHPATKALLESWGAVPAGRALFPGLAPGAYALCVPIIQGASDRTAGGSALHQEVTREHLDIRVIYRVA